MEQLTEALISKTPDRASITSNEDEGRRENSIILAAEDMNSNYIELAGDINGDDAVVDGDIESSFTDHDDQESETYSLDPRRFAILAIFCLNNIIGSAAWITFAPIEDAVQAKFQEYNCGNCSGSISSQQINWLSMISMVVYGPGTAILAWVVPKYGFRETVIASSVLMSLGCVLRWLSLGLHTSFHDGASSNGSLSLTARYSILLIGQGLVALGQTIFTNAPARVAASWFQQTTKSIGAINLCSNLGVMFGQALSPFCVIAATGEHLDQLLCGQAIAMGLCTFFTAFSFRYEEPECPPTASESARRRERQRQYQHSSSSDPVVSATGSVFEEVQKLLTNPQYIILVVAFGINYGLNGAIVTLMQPWLALCGFPGDKTAGLFGALLIGGGVVGTWIASTLLDFTRNFNQAIRWSFVCTAAVALGLVAALYPECPTWILAAAFTITGMTQMPLVTICSDAVAAHTYPVSEELSSAGLQMAGQYLGVFLIDGMSYLIESESDDNSGEEKYGFSAKVNIAYIALLVTSSIFACCYNSEDLRANIAINQGIEQNDGDLTAALLGNTSSHDDNSAGTESSDIDRT